MAKASPVPAKPAIQSDEEAGREAQRYLDLRGKVEEIDEMERSIIAAVQAQFSERRAPLTADRDESFEQVQAWAEATRDGRKTIKFPNGREFRWRKASAPKLIVSGTLDAIIAAILRRWDWKKFLRVELNKSALSASPKVVEQIDGLSLERGEYASIG